MNDIKITPSMVALWHTVATVATGILLPIILGLFQYVSQHGVDVGQDVSYSIPVLITGAATLQVSLWHAIKSSPALPQVEQDVEVQAQVVGGHVANQLGAWLEARMQALESSVLHHQHATPIPASVPQVAFPQAVRAPLSVNTPAGTATSTNQSFVPSQRSWNDSALLPAVGQVTMPPKG